MSNPQNPTEVLRHYAHVLELAAPREWRDFVQVFDAYATEVTVAVTAADADKILVAQGKAQAFLHLLRVFQNTAPKPPPQPQSPPQP